MLFNIEADTGNELIGYLVPDSVEETPRLCLFGGGALLWSGEANETRDALVQAGRHRTGQCGFRIGTNEVECLSALSDLEVRDIGSGLTIYRRRSACLAHKLFRIETRLRPSRTFDHAMERLFQAWYPRVERYGAETVDQVLVLNGTSSVYASGRVHLPAHPGLQDGSTTVVMELRDPHEELAERIAVLSGTFGPVDRFIGAREQMAWRSVIASLDGVNVTNMRALRRAIRGLDPDAAATLSNPLTRQLTSARPSELCAPNAISSALKALAGFEVVAPARIPAYFETAVGTLLNTPVPGLSKPSDDVMWIADTLADIDTVDAIPECDLTVYASVSSVFEGLAAGMAQA